MSLVTTISRCITLLCLLILLPLNAIVIVCESLGVVDVVVEAIRTTGEYITDDVNDDNDTFREESACRTPLGQGCCEFIQSARC